MKKRVISLLLVMAMFTLALTGCGVFSSGDNNSNDNNSDNNDAANSIKITDNYSFELPSDLDFNEHYTIRTSSESEFIADMADVGVIGMVDVVFGKDGAPVAEYTFYICDGEEGSDALLAYYNEMGSEGWEKAGEDKSILFTISDKDTLEGAMLAYASMEMLSENATLKDYAELQASLFGGVVAD